MDGLRDEAVSMAPQKMLRACVRNQAGAGMDLPVFIRHLDCVNRLSRSVRCRRVTTALNLLVS